ncbi:twinkle protein, mitochondrial [Caerostris extrusa]|uniref:Twinkle protein, mitochondrial n=1 Tax=Caerostris extrusa TaxID=172846 RepID=A0AAV4VS98_CAEEX|nr:twinkle protein, mitochondrial [Caerostris extrusa]
MKLEGLSPEFLNRYNVKVSTDLNILIFPFDSLGRECVAIQTLNKKGEKLKVSKYPPELNDDILFGWSAIRPNEKEIIVTSNPLDAVAINQTTDVPAVSLPFGFSKFSTELLSVLKTFKNPDNFCSALQSLQNDSNIYNILKNVEPLHDELLATFDSFKDIVREEIMGHEKTTGVKWKRFSVLNDLMKGHRPGELTIFLVKRAMESAVSCQRVRHLVVDNLQYMMNMEDRFTSLYIQEKNLNFQNSTTLLYLVQLKAIQEADNILILQTTKTRQYLQLTKNRFDGDKGCVALEFDKESLTFNVKKASLNSK